MFLYMLYCCSVTPWRWSRKIETCRSYDKLYEKCNINISAFVGFIVLLISVDPVSSGIVHLQEV